MRRTLLAILVPWAAVPLLAGCAEPDVRGSSAYRGLPKLDLGVFSLAANPEPRLFSSLAELGRAVDALAPKGTRETRFEEARASLMRGVEAAGIRWKEEALVGVQYWYGTGMASGRLEIGRAGAGVVTASVVWAVPPPPVTPDTAVFRAAFVVKRSEVTRVVVTGSDPSPIVLSVPR